MPLEEVRRHSALIDLTRQMRGHIKLSVCKTGQLGLRMVT
jgi:hypothetical protein